MTRAALVVRAAAAGALLAFPAAAAAAPAIDADPSLYPPFRGGTPDYTVRCKAGEAVRFTVDSPSGTRVAVGDRAPRGGRFTASEKLVPGQAVLLRVITGSQERIRYVRCLPRDFPSWMSERRSAPTARWIIATPSLRTVSAGYMIVFDDHGVPVWWARGDPPPFNGELLPNGDLAWTRWVFSRPPLLHYEEHALDGSLVRTYDTDPPGSNPHELRVLPNGDYWMVDYVSRDHVDLSPWHGPRDATVLDGRLQERAADGTVLWQWNSAAHIAPGETAHWYPKLFKDRPVDLGNGRFAYDISHVNSIEPVGDRVVVSLRHTDAVYAIDKDSHKIVWKLGGTTTRKSLKIVGDPYGSHEFGGQHDARALDGGRTITVHENGTLRDRPPRALAFTIDEAKRTATLAESIAYGPAKKSASSGSARRLPDGHWVVSWGNQPYVGELTANGTPVLTIHFRGGFFSYRADPVLAGRLSRTALRRGMDVMVAP